MHRSGPCKVKTASNQRLRAITWPCDRRVISKSVAWVLDLFLRVPLAGKDSWLLHEFIRTELANQRQQRGYSWPRVVLWCHHMNAFGFLHYYNGGLLRTSVMSGASFVISFFFLVFVPHCKRDFQVAHRCPYSTSKDWECRTARALQGMGIGEKRAPNTPTHMPDPGLQISFVSFIHRVPLPQNRLSSLIL
jgi:hypothetical protein